MKLKTKLSTLLLGITSIFVLTAAIVTNPNSGNAIEAKAADELCYTLDTTSTLKGSNNSYAGNCDIKSGDITWNFTGNSAINPWRLGGKSLTNVDRAVYSKTAMTSAIKKIDLTVGTASSITVNSLKLEVSNDADFAKITDTVNATFAASSTISFNPKTSSWVSGSYYRFTFNVTVTNSKDNKYVQFSKVEFYREAGTAVTLQSITAESTQTEVYQNAELDTSAITVTGHYDDGSKKELSSGWTVECDTSVVATGVTATVTHTETNKTATFTVDVVEIPANKTLQLVTSTSELSTGDKIVLVGQKDGKYYANGALNKDYLNSIDVTTAINNSIILLDDFELLTVVKTASSYKFVFEDGKLLSVTTAKELTNTGDGDTEFTINISSEDNAATIQSKTETFGKFLYNATSPRFTTYTSKPTTAMLLPYIYKLNDGNNAGKYADEFLSTVTCDGQGSITAAEGFWNTESTKFDALSAADKKVFSLAEASESGSVEKCVNRYDAIVSKYGTTVYNDFMSRGIVSPSRAIFKPNIIEDAPITEIIVIVSISAVTLIGLFAISKKRKEN